MGIGPNRCLTASLVAALMHRSAPQETQAFGFGHVLSDPATDADFCNNGIPNPQKVELVRPLFFDKELSGNRNICYATCHHPLTDTGDGLSLPVGEGGVGLGMTRNAAHGTADDIPECVARNRRRSLILGPGSSKRCFTTAA